MKWVPGIAGSVEPEKAGVFLAPDLDLVEYFISLNGTGGPVDVWEVSGVDYDALMTSEEGYDYLPEVIPPSRLRLYRQDIV
jgi:hypothetical protein